MPAVNTTVTVKASLACDVLVVGAGLAGTMAALSAARAGARVALASDSHVFSGASFHASTWGLGVVGPKDEDDIDDFCRTVERVGAGVADPALVRTLAEGVSGAEAELSRLGVELMVPERPWERAYIPCFDKRVRSWRGLGRDSYRTAVGAALKQADVVVLEHHSLMDLVRAEGACEPLVTQAPEGALEGALLAHKGGLVFAQAPAVVLATGGIAGIFEKSLMGPQVTGSAHGIALAHGCSLANIEFLQFMPTIVHPVAGIVFNEKTFRYARLEGAPELDALLEERSGYGPFTSRLAARAVDLAIAAAGDAGLALSYERLPRELPEFVAVYFDWLKSATGADATSSLSISHYAHAANGGIAIDANGASALAGLFAAGEAAGGVHGADRVGGLASASALVFGLRAGKAAAEHALAHPASRAKAQAVLLAHPNTDRLTQALKRSVTRQLGVVRTHAGIAHAKRELAELHEALCQAEPARDVASASATARLAQQLRLAAAFAEACDARTQSLGSHYRADSA